MWIEPSLTQAIILLKIRPSAVLVPVILVSHMPEKTCTEHILSCKRMEAPLGGTGFCCDMGWSLLPFFGNVKFNH